MCPLKINWKLPILILLIVTQTGCIKIEKEYYWNRSENERFTLRWKLSSKNILTLLNSYTSDGVTRPYISDYFLPCKFYDNENWQCETISDSESISMTDGELHWHYWSEERIYKYRYKIFFE